MKYFALLWISVMCAAPYAAGAASKTAAGAIAPIYIPVPSVAILAHGLTGKQIVATFPALLGLPSSQTDRPGTLTLRDTALGFLGTYGRAYAVGSPRGIAVITQNGELSGFFIPRVRPASATPVA